MANPSPEMNALEERAWEAWAIATGVAYRDRQHGLCFYDGGTKQMSWRTWQGARAAPPSPSTAPEVDERAAFERHERESNLRRVGVGRDGSGGWYENPCVQSAWEGWQARAALASRPAEASLKPVHERENAESQTRAEVDDDGLPKLPPESARAPKGEGQFYMKWAETGKDLRGELLLFTAEQYRQGQRDAVAADRAKVSRAMGLLREARAALETWKDVAPAVSLCADIDKVLAGGGQ